MKKLTISAMLIAVNLLVACGGSSAPPQSPASAPVTAVEKINGIVVPPDPGATKDDTVAGIDTDHNGIRDEIDRWIATQYGDKPGALDALRMGAMSDQRLLEVVPVNKQEAQSLMYQGFDVGICTYRKLDEEGVNSSLFFNEVMLRTFNTKSRIEAEKHVSNLAGMIVRNIKESTITCPYR